MLGTLEWQPMPHQREAYTDPCKCMCAIWGRRTGKTTTLIWDAHKYTTTHNKTIAIIVPYNPQGDILKKTIEKFDNPKLNNIPIYTNLPKDKKLDGLLIDEADYLHPSTYKMINKYLQTNDRFIVRAYGTRNYSKDENKQPHFWQELDLGPIVSMRFVGSDVLPDMTPELLERLKGDYFG